LNVWKESDQERIYVEKMEMEIDDEIGIERKKRRRKRRKKKRKKNERKKKIEMKTRTPRVRFAVIILQI